MGRTWIRVVGLILSSAFGALSVGCSETTIFVPPPAEETPAEDEDVEGVEDVPVAAPSKDGGSEPKDAGSTAPAKDAGSKNDSGSPVSSSPCGAVSVDGTCTAADIVSTCVVPTGQGSPKVVSQTCPSFAECAVVQGKARCRPKPGQCEPGATECSTANTRRFCDDTGAWASDEPCAGCVDTSVGATCPGARTTTAYSGTIRYEARGPNAALDDWGPIFTSPAVGVLVVSYAWDEATGTHEPIDAVVADGTGSYTVNIPSPGDPKDMIVVWAIRATSSSILFAVAAPDVPDGEWDITQPVPSSGANASFWGWAGKVQDLGPSGSTITITEASGSGALRVFDYLRYAYGATAAILGSSGKSLVIWLRGNTSWSCGACYASWPTTFMGQAFESQIWLPATAQDTSWWADPVTAHELGHWVMASYGEPAREGGPHAAGCPTYPGQAWSEGWATGFSSLARSSPIYYDKQGGTFFWFDVEAGIYDDGTTWSAPTAAGGLFQLMDENVVASFIWRLAASPTEPGALASNAPLFAALASSRMTTAPFARGYTAHTWDGACTRTKVVDRKVSAPMIADYLDALVCAGTSPAKVTSAIGAYPYPVSSPICN